MTNEQSRKPRIRRAEAMIRFQAGLPARDDFERDLYTEWRQLDQEMPPFALEGRGPIHWHHCSDAERHRLAVLEVDQEDARAARAAEHAPIIRPSADCPF